MLERMASENPEKILSSQINKAELQAEAQKTLKSAKALAEPEEAKGADGVLAEAHDELGFDLGEMIGGPEDDLIGMGTIIKKYGNKSISLIE